MKMLTHDIMPCWYELSWIDDPKRPAIGVRVHKDFAEKYLASLPPRFMDVFGFNSFCGDLKKNFGFEAAFERIPDVGDFVSFMVRLPKIQKDELAPCPHCSGSGQGWDENTCISCRGTGQEHKIDWHDSYAVSASFSVFTDITYHNEFETSAKFPQLLTINIVTSESMGGCAINGMFGIPFVNWLARFNGRSILEMTQAMERAHDFMFGLTEFDKYSIGNRVENASGWLNVNCPGDSCGLHPSDSIRPGRGYEFNDHNVDSPLQQITLLAGLAALHDEARKEIK